jgi:hypothetical protein
MSRVSCWLGDIGPQRLWILYHIFLSSCLLSVHLRNTRYALLD